MLMRNSKAILREAHKAVRIVQPALHSLLKLAEGDVIPLTSDERIEYYLFEEYCEKRWDWLIDLFYYVKPLTPHSTKLYLRKKYASVQAKRSFPAWPIEPIIANTVQKYLARVLETQEKTELYRIACWPNGNRFAFTITHDVEGSDGLQNAAHLVEIEKALGFRSSWNLVCEEYPIDWRIVDRLRADGFEIGIHGLRHDWEFFRSRRMFERRMRKLDLYRKEWEVAGFRSPSTMRRIDWMHELEFEYDSSFHDTAPYEPQPGGCCSVWPYFIQNLIEIPITVPQDHTLFDVLGYSDTSIWKLKADWIEQQGGIVVIDVHPDFMLTRDRLRLYEDFLLYMRGKSHMWSALPKEVARWWRDRNSSNLLMADGQYLINGDSSHTGSLVRTSRDGDRIINELLLHQVS